MFKYLSIAIGIVLALVGITVIANVGQTTIPDASEAYYNLANGYNATAIGTGATSLATSSTGWLGYLWVLLPFVLIVGLVMRAIRAR